MLCDGCKKNEANIVLHMMTNGEVATRSLCSDCAQKAHVEMTRAFTTMGMRLEGLQGMIDKAQEERDSIPRMMCSNCRTAYNDIGYDTVFGCPRCYAAFHQQVVGYLTPLKPLEQTTEAVPDTFPVPAVPSMEELESRLSDALQVEDYEHAALIRDQLSEQRAARERADD